MGSIGNCQSLVKIMTHKDREHEELPVFHEMNVPKHWQFPMFPIYMFPQGTLVVSRSRHCARRDITMGNMGNCQCLGKIMTHKDGEHGGLSMFHEMNAPNIGISHVPHLYVSSGHSGCVKIPPLGPDAHKDGEHGELPMFGEDYDP